MEGGISPGRGAGSQQTAEGLELQDRPKEWSVGHPCFLASLHLASQASDLSAGLEVRNLDLAPAYLYLGRSFQLFEHSSLVCKIGLIMPSLPTSQDYVNESSRRE